MAFALAPVTEWTNLLLEGSPLPPSVGWGPERQAIADEAFVSVDRVSADAVDVVNATEEGMLAWLESDSGGLPQEMGFHEEADESEGSQGSTCQGLEPFPSMDEFLALSSRQALVLPRVLSGKVASSSTTTDEELKTFVSACFFSGQGMSEQQVLQELHVAEAQRSNAKSRGIRMFPTGTESHGVEQEQEQEWGSSGFVVSPATEEEEQHFGSSGSINAGPAVPVHSRSDGPDHQRLTSALEQALKHALSKTGSPDCGSLRLSSAVAPALQGLPVAGLPEAAPIRAGQVAAGPKSSRNRAAEQPGAFVPETKHSAPGASSPKWRRRSAFDGEGDEHFETQREGSTSYDEGDDFLRSCGTSKRKRILRERQRRKNIRSEVDRLKAVMPFADGERFPQDTASIIAAAADYIQQLQNKLKDR